MPDPVALPSSPRARQLDPQYIEAGGALRGFTGAVVQTISRLGDHWGFKVSLPQMRWERDARLWVNKLLLGVAAKKVTFPIFLPGFHVGVPGLPEVDGAVAGGSTIPIRGATPHYPFRELQFISVIRNDKRYLYAVSEQTIADASGNASLPVMPMLRAALVDGDVVEVAAPMIEGYLVGEGLTWSISEARTSGLNFQIEERE